MYSNVKKNITLLVVVGADFDIRDFHGEILGAGAVPLSLLEEIVELYIRRTQSNNTE